MSKRSVISLGRIVPRMPAKSEAAAPGPPGFTKRAPMRSPEAGARATKISVVPALGSS
jgi:hypothetical protein